MDYREIPLSQGFVAHVSPEDYEDVIRYSWQVRDFDHKAGQIGLFYAVRLLLAIAAALFVLPLFLLFGEDRVEEYGPAYDLD